MRCTRGNGRLNIKRAQHKNIFGPVDSSCSCYTCRNFTAAYLHHLFRCEELLAYRLATIHNLFFMQRLIEDIRTAIEEGRFPEFRARFWDSYETTDEDRRVEQKLRSIETKRERKPEDIQ